MKPTLHVTTRRKASLLALALSAGLAGSLLAQTKIELPKNKYTPEQDVKIGREGAAEVRKQFPVIEDRTITRYLTELGDRLVDVAPAEFKQPVYEYSFTPVNVKEINAFALPGGPMFVHRGMFDAATSEGEVVGRDGARALARAASGTARRTPRRRKTPGCRSARSRAFSAAPWSAGRRARPSCRARSSGWAAC